MGVCYSMCWVNSYCVRCANMHSLRSNTLALLFIRIKPKQSPLLILYMIVIGVGIFKEEGIPCHRGNCWGIMIHIFSNHLVLGSGLSNIILSSQSNYKEMSSQTLTQSRSQILDLSELFNPSPCLLEIMSLHTYWGYLQGKLIENICRLIFLLHYIYKLY